uniref:Uncharacterized protein n=1 Tax=Arundo donax TaxID=35708 RepID=A0A0A9E015_ARUDO
MYRQARTIGYSSCSNSRAMLAGGRRSKSAWKRFAFQNCSGCWWRSIGSANIQN